MNTAEAAEENLGNSSLALMEAAHPDVYRHNSFRVAGLSVEATPRDISRHTEKLRMMQRYSGGGTVKTPLMLDPPPDEHAVKDALHKLNDPEKRLIDEFFWFWPHQLGQSKNDAALAFLAQDDIENAGNCWMKMEQSSESHVSSHNLAVLFHCLALDWERVALSRTLDAEEAEALQSYWDHAFKRWRVLIDHEPFWSRLSARIRSLEDPRLTTGLSRRMRESTPQAILSINAALAVRYAEAGDIEAARQQVDIMKMWDPGKAQDAGPYHLKVSMSPAAQEALKAALEPIRKRVKSICKNAGSQTDADPTRGDEAARDVIEHTRPLLAVFDCLLPQGHATRDAVHDEVAVVTLQCLIQFGNKTNRWKRFHDLLEVAVAIAAGQSVRDRIQENITTAKNNMQDDVCWFCKENPSADASAIEVKMFGDVTRTPTWNGTQIQWRHITIKVPRCARCKTAHTEEGSWTGVCGGLGFVLGLGGCIASASKNAPGPGFVMLLIFVIGGFTIGNAIGKRKRPPGVEPESTKNGFPRIAGQLAKGWQFGERPATQ
jgi:hypothetical protein